MSLLFPLTALLISPLLAQEPDLVPRQPPPPASSSDARFPLQPTAALSLPVGEGADEGLLLLLDDKDGIFAERSAWGRAIGRKTEAPLQDDGQSADAEAGDDVHTLYIEDLPEGEFLVEVTDADGQTLWLDRAVHTAGQPFPRVEMRLEEGTLSVAARLGTEEEPTPSGAQAQAGGQPPQGQSSSAAVRPSRPDPPSRVQGATAPSGSLPSSSSLSIALGAGLLLGLPLGWLFVGPLRARRGPAPVGQGAGSAPLPGLPAGPEQLPAWVLPHHQARRGALIALARSLAVRERVLLLPSEASRGALQSGLAGLPGAFFLDEPRPAVPRVEQAAKLAGAGGTVRVLVEGPDALAPAGKDEPPATGLARLAALQEGPCTLLMLLLPEEPGSDRACLELSEHAEGLCDAEGELVLRAEGDALTLA